MKKRMINGYEYGITSCGKVWSFLNNKFLKTSVNNSGYEVVNIGNHSYLIHRLVAEAYISNPEGFKDVDHIDGDKKHNYVRNLQWISHKNNIKKTHDIKVKCVETNTTYSSFVEAGNAIGKHPSGISACIRGKQKTCGGFHWEVIE